MVNKQALSMLILGKNDVPSFDAIYPFRCVISGLLAFVSLIHT
jgi:hypothetical protein